MRWIKSLRAKWGHDYDHVAPDAATRGSHYRAEMHPTAFEPERHAHPDHGHIDAAAEDGVSDDAPN